MHHLCGHCVPACNPCWARFKQHAVRTTASQACLQAHACIWVHVSCAVDLLHGSMTLTKLQFTTSIILILSKTDNWISLNCVLRHISSGHIPVCSAMIAPTNLGPARVTAAAFWAMTLATISTTAMTATKGAKGAVRVTAFGKFWFRAAPNTTGTSTTWNNHAC